MTTKIGVTYTGWDKREALIDVAPFLIKDTCDCETKDFLCFPKTGECPCTIHVGHVHCKHCGGVIRLPATGLRLPQVGATRTDTTAPLSDAEEPETEDPVSPTLIFTAPEKPSLWDRVKSVAQTLLIMYVLIWFVKIAWMILKFIF